jgi:asparagine synthase (glutamine-hydrolysing)
LNGRFHGILVDRQRGTASLFNDRYGMHRIYYHESPNGIYISAEAKAILAVCPAARRIDWRGMGEFVSCGAVLENRTLFDGIQLLPPGSMWTFRNGSIEKRKNYFSPSEWEGQESLDSESYYHELRDAFSKNLPRYFAGREQIGMSLTGGLDTRMIMAWQNRQAGSLPCYTYGGMLRDCQDVIVGREVARACGQTYEVIQTGREFLSQFPQFAERAVYLSDGCVDVSRAPDVYLSEKAREIAPIRMTGLFGGEVLRGVRAFKPMEPASDVFCPEFLMHIRETKDTFARIVNCHPITFAAFRQAPWHQNGGVALEQTQVSVRSPFLDNDVVRTAFRAPGSALKSDEFSQRLIADGSGTLEKIATDRGVGGGGGQLSRAASRFMLEFLFKAEYRYDMGMPQSVARLDRALSNFRIERLFLGRHKIFHFRIWYRDELAGYIREILLDPRTRSRPYFKRGGLETIVAGHLKGDRNYTNEIHKALTLELFHRLFLEAQ